MLSILIPIYNQDIRKLILELSQQCQKEGILFQLLCFDDGSKDKYKTINRKIETVFGVSYLEFDQNMGRSRIRNKLAYNAMYENILFLDCDSEVKSKKFIKSYKRAIKGNDTVYGGTLYSKRKPKTTAKMLHWKYGQKREIMNVKKRNKHPYSSFRSNNFMIKRSIFLTINFDEKIFGYGHEDTLFAQRLKDEKIKLVHIDNPVIHGGLEKTPEYLDKVDESIKNLVGLNNRGYTLRTRLVETYNFLESWHLLPIMRWAYSMFEENLPDKLDNKDPNLYLLDLFKLNVYDKLVRK